MDFHDPIKEIYSNPKFPHGTLRLVSTVHEPWTNECFDQLICDDRGIEFDFTVRLLNILGYTWSASRVNSSNKAIEMLQNGTADINVQTISATSAVWTELKVAFTQVISQDQLVFWTKDQQYEPETTNIIFAGFHWTLWVTLAFVTLFVLSVEKVRKYLGKYLAFEMLISFSSMEGLINVSWVIVGLFLGIYANILAIILSIPGVAVPPFRDLDDLSWKLYNQECKIVVIGDYNEPLTLLATIKPSLNSTNVPESVRRRLLEAYDSNPPIRVKDMDIFIDYIKRDQCYIGVGWYAARHLVLSKYCGVRWYFDEHSEKTRFVQLYRKELERDLGAGYNALLILSSADEAFFQLIERKANSKLSGCAKPSTMTAPINLAQIKQTFVILVSAMVISVVTFALEFVHTKYKKTVT